jgi:Flp pilus assembly protein CpaB
MNKKAVIPLVAGLGIGGFALKIGFDTIQKAKGAQQVQTAQVWTAARDIPRGTAISEELLKPLAFPAKLVPEGVFTEKDKEKLIGRVPRIDTTAGQLLFESGLCAPGTQPGLQVPHGYRAVAVKIDESSGVDNHLTPGCRVDVVGYFTDNRSGKQITQARTLIENVEVAAVGAKVSVISEESPAEKNKTKADLKPARAVTLFVRPENVPTLHLAEQRGKLKLSKRNDDDAAPVDLSKVTQETQVTGFIDEPGKKADGPGLGGTIKNLFARGPAAPPPPVVVDAPPGSPKGYAVRLFQGNSLEIVRFKDENSRERIGGDPAPDRRSAGDRSAAPQAPAQKPGGAPPKDNPAPQPASNPDSNPGRPTEDNPEN